MAAVPRPRFALLFALSLLVLPACGGGGGSGTFGDATDMELPDGAECFDNETRCTADGVEVCSGGLWGPPTACEFGCDAGRCLDTAPASSCSLPIELTLGSPYHSTTEGGLSSHSWSDACRLGYGYSPSGPETVFHFSLDNAANVSVELSAIDATYYAVYLRGADCNAPGELSGACQANDTPGNDVSLEYLLGAGDHYVIVDDFGANGEGPGAFDLTVTPTPIPTCHGQTPTFLDVSTGTVEIEGNTDLGSTGASWHGGECQMLTSSAGKEQIYFFNLQQRAEVQIAATAIEPSPSQMALYLRDDCDVQFAQVACGFASGDSPTPATITTTLESGTYFLFVDDFIGSVDDPQTYSLSMQITPL